MTRVSNATTKGIKKNNAFKKKLRVLQVSSLRQEMIQRTYMKKTKEKTSKWTRRLSLIMRLTQIKISSFQWGPESSWLFGNYHPAFKSNLTMSAVFTSKIKLKKSSGLNQAATRNQRMNLKKIHLEQISPNLSQNADNHMWIWNPVLLKRQKKAPVSSGLSRHLATKHCLYHCNDQGNDTFRNRVEYPNILRAWYLINYFIKFRPPIRIYLSNLI